MAQKVIIQLVDDINGEEAHETVSFGLDGNNYEIDLTNKHADKLRTSLEQYVSNARKGKNSKAKRGVEPKVIRAWAQAHGVQVNEKGRISADVVKAYEAAQ